MASVQLRLFTGRTGPRGFPLCGGCNSEGIGQFTPWCVRHWTPERDPEGAALWVKIRQELGLPAEEDDV